MEGPAAFDLAAFEMSMEPEPAPMLGETTGGSLDSVDELLLDDEGLEVEDEEEEEPPNRPHARTTLPVALDVQEQKEQKSPPAKTAAIKPAPKAGRTRVRRATVRYYTRMNPERVFPLLVLITKEMIQKTDKKDTDQRSSKPFQVDVGSPVEIEPVLPGCDCHPPKIIARLVGGELTATFRVVPRVVGKVEGASVTIRQDHIALAEIVLDMKVVQRIWVVFAGAMAFVLPGMSAILKHFGITFQGQEEQGFSLYLAITRLVMDKVSPLGLTVGLGFVTGLIWWFTRPQVRDVFWDIEKVGPAKQLQQIMASMASNPQQAARSCGVTEYFSRLPTCHSLLR